MKVHFAFQIALVQRFGGARKNTVVFGDRECAAVAGFDDQPFLVPVQLRVEPCEDRPCQLLA